MYCNIKFGDVLYVPPGYIASMVATDAGFSGMVFLPLLSKKVLAKVPGHVKADVKAAFDGFLVKCGMEQPWPKLKDEIEDYLK